MNKLPAKRSDPEVEETPTWSELRERAADLLKSLVREGQELERDLEPKLLPGLKALKAKIEKLIATLEERITRR